MMRFLILLLASSIVIISCGEAVSEDAPSQQTAPDTVRYGNTAFSFPRVHPNTQLLLEDWPIYSDFEEEIVSLQSIPLERVKIVSEKLLTETDSLFKSIPGTLKSQAVSSRLIVLKTRINLLLQEANKGKVDPSKIEEEITETRNAAKNFVIQVDEKVQKDKIDLQRKDNEEKELEKQQRARDSIFQLELQDQQK